MLVGENGQGKTNFLEACWLVATLRPLRAQRTGELLRWGEPTATATARFQTAAGTRLLEVELARGERRARLDGKNVADPDTLFGSLAVVAFTPDDLGLVKGPPEGRRRLLDRAVQNRWPAHLADARDYLRALRSRNELLRRRAEPALLQAFDEPLVRLGARLRNRRARLLAELSPLAREAFREVTSLSGETGAPPALGIRPLLSGGSGDSGGLGQHAAELGTAAAAPPGTEPASDPGAEPAADLADAQGRAEAELRGALAQRLPRDLERGFTSAGPHADDLSLSLSGHPARLYASQGQCRAIVLALKMGEIECLRRAQGRSPLLLLDDVSSELDPARTAHLFRYLRGLQGQLLLTTTDLALVATAEAPLVYEVKAGALRALRDRTSA